MGTSLQVINTRLISKQDNVDTIHLPVKQLPEQMSRASVDGAPWMRLQHQHQQSVITHRPFNKHALIN